MKKFFASLVVLSFCALVAINAIVYSSAAEEMPFGGEKDVAFASAFWQAMQGYEKWPMRSDFYPGQSPHGKVLRLYYNMVNLEGTPYHVIIKDNYGGENATVENVSKSPQDFMAAVTIMVQREAGYDKENDNWFWAKYMPDGSLDKNAQGVKMAGRVAKGMNAGCIACHKKAQDGDYLFSND